MRLITVQVRSQEKRSNRKGNTGAGPSDGLLRIATNLLDLPAETIALVFQHRYITELFIRFFRHLLSCQHLLSDKTDGVRIQVSQPLYVHHHYPPHQTFRAEQDWVESLLQRSLSRLEKLFRQRFPTPAHRTLIQSHTACGQRACERQTEGGKKCRGSGGDPEGLLHAGSLGIRADEHGDGGPADTTDAEKQAHRAALQI